VKTKSQNEDFSVKKRTSETGERGRHTYRVEEQKKGSWRGGETKGKG